MYWNWWYLLKRRYVTPLQNCTTRWKKGLCNSVLSLANRNYLEMQQHIAQLKTMVYSLVFSLQLLPVFATFSKDLAECKLFHGPSVFVESRDGPIWSCAPPTKRSWWDESFSARSQGPGKIWLDKLSAQNPGSLMRQSTNMRCTIE